MCPKTVFSLVLIVFVAMCWYYYASSCSTALESLRILLDLFTELHACCTPSLDLVSYSCSLCKFQFVGSQHALETTWMIVAHENTDTAF